MSAAIRLRGLVLAAVTLAAAVARGDDREAFFESRIRPLLVEKCQGCHGGKVAEAGLRLDSRRGVLAGSVSGPIVVEGDASQSRMLAAVKRSGDLAMPPDEPLHPDEVATLERWITDGLHWSGPGGEDAAAAASDMESRLAAARASHWAFRAPERHAAPEVSASFDPAIRAAWSEAPIDRFVAAGIAAAGIVPSPPAAPHDLVRRLYLDLTGLPPTAEEADAFCRDPGDAAYAALVERLLATPEHAEHWARKWLDLARYADTVGYAFDGQESRYPFAWTYRDWVVGALAADLPYDRFVTLQIAADLVDPPAPRADLAALGFLTVGRTFLGNEHDIIDDRIDLVTRGLMGLSVACARCHDHKYEPVTTADYYALHGIFASSQTPKELPVIAEPPPGPEADAFREKLAELEARVPAHEAAVHARATREAVAHATDYLWETARPSPRGSDKRPPRLADGYEMEQLLLDRLGRKLEGCRDEHAVLGPWVALKGLADDACTAALPALLEAWGRDNASLNAALRTELVAARPATLRAVAEAYGRIVARAHATAGTPEDTAELAAIRAELTVPGAPLVVLPTEAMRVANREESTKHRSLQRDVTRHQADAPGGPPRAMTITDKAAPQDSHVFLRGNPGRKGAVVPRRMPSLLGGATVSTGSSGRLELARTITAPANPLAPRLIVNWVWTHHFGRGLIDTPGDLGLRGAAPSHPDLLDDLARRFVDEGRFSLRWLHREIVTSRAWRQSAAIRSDLAAADPDNLLLARANRRRLDWEAWRDGLLAAAGTLDRGRRGGPGIDPLAIDSMAVRSLYARLDRQDVPGIMRVFDIANPDTAVHVRTRTSVPQQSLAVLNAPLVVEAARRLAERAAAADDETFVVQAWRAALARDPAAEERLAAVEWLVAEAAVAPAAGEAGFGPRHRLAQALLATAEFQFVD